MVRISIEAAWNFTNGSSSHSMRILLGFLYEVKISGTIARAAERSGMSFRHAWNLVDQWSSFFGEPLVERTRGKGSTLTALGNKLVRADQHLKARLGPQLHNIAQELETEIASLLPDLPPRIRIHASHGFAISALSEFLSKMPNPCIDLRYMSNQASLDSLRAKECELAAIHVPHGDLRRQSVAALKKWLNPSVYSVIGFVTREMGLYVKRGNPLNITTLAQIRDPRVTFVNRDVGSGSRMLLEQLLNQLKIRGDEITGFQIVEQTHAAVAANVARGMADAGFGVAAPAHDYDLDFVHVITEDYFFICPTAIINSKPVEILRKIISNPEFRRTVNSLEGYAVADSGAIKTVRKFFDENRFGRPLEFTPTFPGGEQTAH